MQSPPGYPPGGGPPYPPPPQGPLGYGPPPQGPPGYMPPPQGPYGPAQSGYNMAPPPPLPQSKKSDFPVALFALFGLVIVCVTGAGGCLVCWLFSTAPTTTAAQAPPAKTANEEIGSTRQDTSTTSWIQSEKPYVKFMAPPGWEKVLKGDWGVFKSTDGAAVFAFTTFNQPGESTARLGKAAWVLGVDNIEWRAPIWGFVGKDRFRARMGEGSCNFNGPNGYIWYATVDSGTSDQILLIYTVSAMGTKEHKDAVIAAIDSLQNR